MPGEPRRLSGRDAGVYELKLRVRIPDPEHTAQLGVLLPQSLGAGQLVLHLRQAFAQQFVLRRERVAAHRRGRVLRAVPKLRYGGLDGYEKRIDRVGISAASAESRRRDHARKQGAHRADSGEKPAARRIAAAHTRSLPT